ncbi:glycosyltransferase [Acidobacteriota bacterium]
MKVYVAIPVLDELEWIDRCLDALAAQDYPNAEIWLCVNQPEAWWDDPNKHHACEHNLETLRLLKISTRPRFREIDRCSPGRGWAPGEGGVGRARKTIMDRIAEEADEDDLIVSLDADTVVSQSYLSDLVDSFRRFPEIIGIAAPYYHRLTGTEAVDRQILRYECYLRNYALNLWRIGSPYAYTALGSAVALTVRNYRSIGGMPARESGEDFYFFQRMRKAGRLIQWLPSRVYPATRFSDRVPFGTGAAMLKGAREGWDAYPIFPMTLFDRIGETVHCFPALFEGDVETPLTPFLQDHFRTDDFWEPLRRNHSSVERFARACHERLDGLRIFQYLRTTHKGEIGVAPGSDELNLMATLRWCRKQFGPALPLAIQDCRQARYPFDTGEPETWSFKTIDLATLDIMRRYLCAAEDCYRRLDIGLE